jgi:hypothetical protein
MAIQFNCPYCTSPIRVPDSSGGKRGKCPQCQSKLRVPKPEALTPDLPPKQVDIAPPADDIENPKFDNLADVPAEVENSENLFAAPQPTGRGEFPGTSSEPTHSPGSYSRALKQRRQRKSQLWIPMLIGILLVGGIAGWFFFTSQEKLEGTLSATELIDPKLDPQVLSLSYIDLDSEKKQAVQKFLDEHPIRGLDSGKLMEHDVESTPDGLSVRVFAPSSMRFYQVHIGGNSALKNYYKEHGKSLDKPRLKDLETSATAFYEECLAAASEEGNISSEGLEQFRRNVAVNLMVKGLGYNLLASVKGKAYICVYEDDKSLYFLLPKGTKSFKLKGRELADGTTLFPGKYQVDVTKTKKSDVQKTTPEPDQPSEEKTDEPEMKTTDENVKTSSI